MKATTLEKYRKLHDGLSDMIEEGRLTEADIPDDYAWLVEALAELAGLDPEDCGDCGLPNDSTHRHVKACPRNVCE